MLYYALFFFLAMGAKLLLALVMIYLLLPSDRNCNHCDGETILLQLTRSNLWLSRVFLRRLTRRWCPACGWEGYSRHQGLHARRRAAVSDPAAPTPP